MDYKAIIDFNKYTLTLAAGGFVYALTNYKEPGTVFLFWIVLVMLVLFLLSTLSGILVASTATSRLHRPVGQRPNPDYLIKVFGISHVIMLLFGMVLLGILVFTQFKFPDPNNGAKAKKDCCCCQSK